MLISPNNVPVSKSSDRETYLCTFVSTFVDILFKDCPDMDVTAVSKIAHDEVLVDAPFEVPETDIPHVQNTARDLASIRWGMLTLKAAKK